MREECGERGSLDFRIRVLRSLVLGVAVPARTGKQRNRIWSQNEICGCDSLLCRTLWPFRWARKPTHQSGASSVRGFDDRSTGSGVRSVRSIRPCTIQPDPQRSEGHCPSFFPFGRLVTLLQSAARAAAKRKTEI